MAVTGCNYGAHSFTWTATIRDHLHLHECAACGAAYMSEGAGPCYSCAKPEAD